MHAAVYFFVTSDDALITLRYAQNLAAGHGAVYNPGGPPVEGFSNPAFTVFTALLIRLGLAPVIAAKCVGLVSLLLLCGVLPALSRAIDGRGARVAGAYSPVASLFLASSTYVVFWSVAGLETVSHALLICYAVLRTMRDTEHERTGLAPLAWLAVAASRPEGAFIGAFAFAAQWILLGLRPRVVVRWTLLFGFPALALLALRYAYYGALVPNTFVAKVSFGENSTLWGLRQLAAFATDGGYLLLIPAAAFVFARLGRTGVSATWLIALSVVAAQALFVVVVGGDFMPAYRFLIPVYPLLCVFAAAGYARLASLHEAHGAHRTNRQSTIRSFGRPIAWIAIAASCVALPYVQRSALQQHPLRFWLQHDRPWHEYIGSDSFDGTWLEAHERAGAYIRERSRPGDRLAVTEAGTIPFVAGLDTIDMLGLNHRKIALLWQRAGRQRDETRRYAARGRSRGEPGSGAVHAYDVPIYVLGQRPRWIVIDGSYHTDRDEFAPRLSVASTLVQTLQFAAYRKVFEAKVYDGQELGLGADRIDVVFELRGSRRAR